MKLKRIMAAVMTAGIMTSALTGCGSKARKITVVSREDGSGT